MQLSEFLLAGAPPLMPFEKWPGKSERDAEAWSRRFSIIVG